MRFKFDLNLQKTCKKPSFICDEDETWILRFSKNNELKEQMEDPEDYFLNCSLHFNIPAAST